MVKFIQLVVGPAGTGKSTYCKTLQDHCRTMKRTMYVGNLDPAAEEFGYDLLFDIKDLISLEDVMETLQYGPNGGLVYCMEYLLHNTDWLQDQLDLCGDDEYILLDCPGQVELYSHLPIMHHLVKQIELWGFRVVSVYLLDALFILEPYKFISGCMLSLSCMLQLGIPHINVVTKCDLADKTEVLKVLESESASWISKEMNQNTSKPFKRLTEGLGSIIDDYMMIGFVMLDVNDEDSITAVIAHTDHAVQYGEDVEPNEPVDENNLESEEYES